MKNSLQDLNNYLFESLERINDDDLTDEELEKEIKRSEAVTKVASTIINNAEVQLKALQYADEYGYNNSGKHLVGSMVPELEVSDKSGQYFEGMITASLNWYRDMGVAYIEKTPEPMKPLRAPNRQGQFLACFTKQGQPDFKGTLTGGRSVVFEAKHTDDDKIEYGRLTHEQIEALSQHHKLGAAAFVLVSIKLENFYRIPWTTWRDMKQIYGRKHIKQAELEPFRLQYISGVIKMLEGIEISYTEEGDENEQ